jgi:hypothetical protein
MELLVTVETDLFEHCEVKPHFINPCCFGEDFAVWLIRAIAPTTSEFKLSETIQEDYGWGFWGRHGKDSFWGGHFIRWQRPTGPAGAVGRIGES